MGGQVGQGFIAGAVKAVKFALPPRQIRLRMLAHGRRIVVGILPLGALVGLAMTLILLGLERHLAPAMDGLAERLGVPFLLPLAALVLATQWLSWTVTGAVNLFEDLDLARHSPFEVFPFRRSLWKVIGCGFTIGLGGSTGMEGPAKWLGASLGVQWHRFLRWLALRIQILRRLKSQPMTMVVSGAAAAVAVVFRAPLSGALFAVEHDGHVDHKELIPSVIAAASAYMVWVAFAGMTPLIPITQGYTLAARELLWALPVGFLCGLIASLFLYLRRVMTQGLGRLPLVWRGLMGGVGLALLALPGHYLFQDLQVTQRGGLELILRVLGGEVLPRSALLMCALKLLATALTLAAGGVGGMWICTVAMGSCLGAVFAAWMMPQAPGLIVLLAGAAFAGAVHEVLLVPVVFLAETTGQPALVVPGLIAATVALLVKQEHI